MNQPEVFARDDPGRINIFVKEFKLYGYYNFYILGHIYIYLNWSKLGFT